MMDPQIGAQTGLIRSQTSQTMSQDALITQQFVNLQQTLQKLKYETNSAKSKMIRDKLMADLETFMGITGLGLERGAKSFNLVKPKPKLKGKK